MFLTYFPKWLKYYMNDWKNILVRTTFKCFCSQFPNKVKWLLSALIWFALLYNRMSHFPPPPPPPTPCLRLSFLAVSLAFSLLLSDERKKKDSSFKDQNATINQQTNRRVHLPYNTQQHTKEPTTYPAAILPCLCYRSQSVLVGLIPSQEVDDPASNKSLLWLIWSIYIQ